ncbi:hypothetical protein LZ198_25735 [Myxococcus sp. K15C18031901]|uniref:hypothetical protein n=1 Tax=Myxococcus dinghuensis TaxID=2906761 RepID=UPI0020A835C9|nr:hypothetical protein [Myxococcus dinghuensis]MCP3102276.1 hypothetical protein [Myxococcus dinghuensis]
MSTHQDEAFHERNRRLEQQAMAALESPQDVAPALPRGTPWLRIWEYRSLGQYRSWLLWKDASKLASGFLVRRVTWTRHGEVERSMSPGGVIQHRVAKEPRLLTADAPVASERWWELEAEGRELPVPNMSFGPLGISLDGVRFGLEQRAAFHSLRLEWWSRPPADWRPVVKWFDRVHELFEDCLPPSEQEP